MQPNEHTLTNHPGDNPEPKRSAGLTAAVAAGVLLILIGLGLILSHHSNNNSSGGSGSTNNAAVSDADYDGYKYEATITVNDNGFNPATLSVKPDTRVYWKSADGDTATHHIVQSEDNTKEPVFGGNDSRDFGTDGGYAYSFRRTGTYKYHDSKNPALNGEIIVQN